MRTIVKGKNVEVPERVRDYTERKLAPARAPPRRPHRRHRRVLERAPPQRVGRPHRRGHAGHRRPDAAQPRGRDQLPGGPRHRRRQGRAPGGRPQVEAARPRPPRGGEATSSARSPTAPPSPARERRIVKTKRFAIEPMFEEDAIAAMEELGPPVLRVRRRRDRADRGPVRARRRRLRPHRAGRRRRVHARARQVARGAADAPADGQSSAAPVLAGVAGHEPGIDHPAPDRRDVRVEQREALVDLAPPGRRGPR